MMMNYPTLEDIKKMENKRIERAKQLIEEEKAKENSDEKRIKMLERRIWMIQNG